MEKFIELFKILTQQVEFGVFFDGGALSSTLWKWLRERNLTHLIFLYRMFNVNASLK